MIKHIVLWMLKPEAKSTPEILRANMERQMARFREMEAASSTMRGLRVYPGVRSGDQVYDFAVVMEFDSLEDLETFESSPNHRDPQARKFGMQIREKKAVIDIELS